MSQRPLEDTLKDNMCVVFGHAHTNTLAPVGLPSLSCCIYGGRWSVKRLWAPRDQMEKHTHTHTHSKGGLITSALLGFIDTLGNHSLISPQRKEKYTDYMNVCEKEWEEETEWMMGERACEWGSSFTSEMGNVSEVYNNRTE